MQKKIFKKKKRFIRLKAVSSIWQSYIENKSICLKNEKKMRSSYFEPGGGSLILNTTVTSLQKFPSKYFNYRVDFCKVMKFFYWGILKPMK